jgi:hypothetical protein
MRIVATERARAFVAEAGGEVWVWLDPHRGPVGSYVWLEAHCEPPQTSRKTRFTRSSRRPHHFQRTEQDDIVVHYDFGRMPLPEELHFDVKGLRAKTRRLEAYWNGSVFVGVDVPAPGSE